MGNTKSITNAPVDIVSSYISNVTTEIINKNSQTSTESNSIVVGCEASVLENVNTLCDKALASRNALIATLSQSGNKSLANTIAKQAEPSICSKCTVTDIKQTINKKITMNNDTTNAITNDLKAKLTSQLDEDIKKKVEGGIGNTTDILNAQQTIKNYVETNITNKFITDTLTSFTSTNSIVGTNVQIRNINQSIAGEAIAANIMNTAIDNKSDVTAALDVVYKTDLSTTGSSFSLGFGIIGIIVSVIIILVLGGFAIKILKSDGNKPAAQQTPSPFGSMFGNSQQQQGPMYGPDPMYGPQQYDPMFG
jgi:hypothetical protein